MKKLSTIFQKGDLKQKISLLILVPLITTIIMYLLYSIIFLIITVLGGASFLVSILLGWFVLLIAIMFYPVKKDVNEYSNYTRKYL